MCYAVLSDIHAILTVAEAFDDFERLQTSQAALSFFGHTHRAVSYEMVSPFSWEAKITRTRWPEGGVMELCPAPQFLVNPGSVGQPRDGNPHTRDALFDSSAQAIKLREPFLTTPKPRATRFGERAWRVNSATGCSKGVEVEAAQKHKSPEHECSRLWHQGHRPRRIQPFTF